VVFNGDPSRLSGGHLGDAARSAVAPITAPRSLSAMTWSMLARPTGLSLGYHTVCFGDDYADEFAALFERGHTPARPTVYLCAPDRMAGTPEGDERLFCLINAPAGLPRDDEGEATCRAAMEQSLRACGLELHPSRPAIAAAPAHFAERFPGTEGAIYGAATHGALAAFRRPAIATRLPNLWLVGGASHPGAGLPMVTLGGLWAARRIAADLASTRTSALVATSGGTSTASTLAATTPSP
jgi:1-hydroxycarotenoid 3,4-desaturase